MIAALDIATHCGAAVQTGPRHFTTWTFTAGEESLPVEAAKMADMGVVTCALERPYMGLNVTTYGKLMALYSIAQLCLHQAGIETIGVTAQQWQSSYGITGDREARKMGARRIAQWLGAKVKNQDEADAVCLCAYAAGITRAQAMAKPKEVEDDAANA